MSVELRVVWEYKVVQSPGGLDKYGADGWELVAVDFARGPSRSPLWCAVFKRPVVSGATGTEKR